MVLTDRQVATGAGAAGQGEPQCVGTEHLDPVQWIDAVAAGLAHLAAEFVANQAVQEDVFERYLRSALPVQRDGRIVGDEHAEHHHSRHPEEQDVVAGDQDARRIELGQFGAAVGPAHGGERPQRRGEPGVQHVRVLFPTFGRGFVRTDADCLTVGPVPDRNAMAPPQLPRYAPVVHVVDPAEPAWFQAGWVNHGVPVTDRIARRLGQRFDLDPPLQRQPRFDGFPAALGMSDAVQIRSLLLDDATLRGQRLAHRDAGVETVHAVEFGSGVGDPALGVHDRRHR